MRKRTIVLAMIVKDEAHCIERCLDSVKDYVNGMVIHDTGSTDGTQEVIRKYFEANKIEGTVTTVPWVDFGHNRSKVLSSARQLAPYTFMLDADEVLRVDKGAFLVELCGLDKDIYQMQVKLGNCVYERNFLFRNDREWTYRDPIHEYAHVEGTFSAGRIINACIVSHHDGARSKNSNKYLGDAQLLEGIENRTPRQQFYLAQSYKDAGELQKAVDAYVLRSQMHGYTEERFYSLYMMGHLTGSFDRFFNAFLFGPKRAEPLLAMGKLLMDKGNWQAAILFLREAATLPIPEGALFIELDVYTWRAEMELYVCMYYMGQYSTALTCNERLLDKVPESVRPQVKENIRFCAEKLHAK